VYQLFVPVPPNAAEPTFVVLLSQKNLLLLVYFRQRRDQRLHINEAPIPPVARVHVA
jgi:hypothetical protein